MRVYSYDEWLAREPLMRRRAAFILQFFDCSRLQRKPPSLSRERPSRRTARPPRRDLDATVVRIPA